MAKAPDSIKKSTFFLRIRNDLLYLVKWYAVFLKVRKVYTDILHSVWAQKCLHCSAFLRRNLKNLCYVSGKRHLSIELCIFSNQCTLFYLVLHFNKACKTVFIKQGNVYISLLFLCFSA